MAAPLWLGKALYRKASPGIGNDHVDGIGSNGPQRCGAATRGRLTGLYGAAPPRPPSLTDLLDTDGHGTHTSGTTAGSAGPSGVPGYPRYTPTNITGMAPGAKIAFFDIGMQVPSASIGYGMPEEDMLQTPGGERAAHPLPPSLPPCHTPLADPIPQHPPLPA